MPQDLALLVGRFLLGASFLINGGHNYQGLAEHVVFYARLGIPLPQFLAPFSVGFMLLTGVLLIVGYQTRLAAALVGGFWLLDAIVVLGALRLSGDASQFLKDMAVVGGCLAFVAAGAGRFSIDGRGD